MTTPRPEIRCPVCRAEMIEVKAVTGPHVVHKHHMMMGDSITGEYICGLQFRGTAAQFCNRVPDEAVEVIKGLDRALEIFNSLPEQDTPSLIILEAARRYQSLSRKDGGGS